MKRFLTLTAIILLALAPTAEAKIKKPAPPPTPVPEVSRIPRFAPIVVTYDVYVGGADLLTADILFREQDRDYTAHMDGKTAGFWNRLLPWHADLKVTGHIIGDKLRPVDYLQRDETKKVKVTHLTFDQDGTASASFEPPADDPNSGHVTDEQRKGVLDPISALLQMAANYAINNSCDMTVPVFDGKRRFDISGHDGGMEDIDEADYSAFKGTAKLCNANFTLLSGEWKDKDKAKFWTRTGEDAGRDPFHVWLGKVTPDLPMLPVRLESTSVWGLIVVHLSKWRYATAADQ